MSSNGENKTVEELYAWLKERGIVTGKMSKEDLSKLVDNLMNGEK